MRLLRQFEHIIFHLTKEYVYMYCVDSAGPCNAHVHSSTQHTCGGGNSSPSNIRCNGTDNTAYTENYLSPSLLPTPQQPTVYSHPEARGPPSFGSPFESPCPVLPIIVI